MDFEWNKHIKDALDQTEFMALSTVGEDGSWTCPVKFGYSERAVLYFISTAHTKHVKNLLKDKRVSVAIFRGEVRTASSHDVVGVQIKGTAERLTAREDVEEAARCYYARGPERADYKTKVDSHMDGVTGWNFFKVTPEELWYFNPLSFGQERVKVTLENLRLAIG